MTSSGVLADQQPLLDVFLAGAQFDHPQFGALTPEVFGVGTLHVTGTFVGAGDPLTSDLGAHFQRAVSPGMYPVEIATATVDGAPRVLAARVLFADAQTKTFDSEVTTAVTADFDGAPPGGSAYLAEGVGCFCDAARAATWDSLEARQALEAALDGVASTGVPAVAHPQHSSGLLAFRTRHANVDAAVAPSQVLASYFGLGGDGRPKVLWTDLGLLHEAAFDAIALPRPLTGGRLEDSALARHQLTAKVTRLTGQLVITGGSAAVQTVRLRCSGDVVPPTKTVLTGAKGRRVYDVRTLKTNALVLDVLTGERPLVARFAKNAV